MTTRGEETVQPFSVLISSVGRRSQLIKCFREALQELGVQGRVIGIDLNPEYAPAAHLVDKCYQVPRCTDSGFLNRVLSICRDENVRLIVPTIDPELPVYAEARSTFAASGVQVAVSGPVTVGIASDKAETNRWLRAKGLPTVRQVLAADIDTSPEWSFPVIVKPRCGSASIGVAQALSKEMLSTMLASARDLVVEEYARGEEHTINVFVDRPGHCVCTVPHSRIETRGGEVSKGVTVKDPRLMQIGKQVAELLPDAFGALNIQCFLSPSGEILITEINARFGGGFPLANAAGALFPVWLLQGLLGLPAPTSFDCWTDRLVMLRYDSAVFVQES